MKLIDILRRQHAELSQHGLRVGAWQLSDAFYEQLFREGMNSDVRHALSISPPVLFGAPLERSTLRGLAQADAIAEHCRFSVCQHLDRLPHIQWDVFDLDKCEPHGAAFSSKADAQRLATALDFLWRGPRA